MKRKAGMTIDGNGHCILTPWAADNLCRQQTLSQSQDFQQRVRVIPITTNNRGKDDMRNQAIGECKAFAESACGSHLCIKRMIDYLFHH